LGKLSFVGLGLGLEGISVGGMKEIKEADVVYLETYTSPDTERRREQLEKWIGKRLRMADRFTVEEGRSILEEASTKHVVLAAGGDPIIATTHNDLRVRAITAGVETRIFYASSIASAAPGASGLHFYKFGRPITFAEPSPSVATEVYRVVHANLIDGLHTLVLLPYDSETDTGVSPYEAMKGLLAVERNLRRRVLFAHSLGLVLCRLGNADEQVFCGQICRLLRKEYGQPPHSLVIPGKLHFTESESLAALFKIPEGQISDNSRGIKRTAGTLVPKYVRKTSSALRFAKEQTDNRYGTLLENVELYLKDAQSFLAKDEDELAMFSVGYAEGLLDSLNFTGVVKIDW
jgi:diphthine synthase